jgi:two-component system probable response regulator PhcQ
MHNKHDYKEFAILYVDDEEKSLTNFERAFRSQFRILTAASAQAGLRLLEEHKDDIGLMMTDQRMPGEQGVWLLEKARQLRPRIIRILATAYADMDAAIAAVNTGAIYKYVTKPWDPPQLEQTLMRGLEFFLVQRERDKLLKEKLSVLHNMMIADRIMSLGLLAAGMSHHIRNSLVAVKTFLDLAPSKLREEKLGSEELRDPAFWKEYYQSVQGQIEKINNMLKDLWAASEKPSMAFPDQVRLHAVVAEALDKLKERFAAGNLRVQNQIPEDLPLLNVDRPKFYQLFELLLKDEIVSLPPGSLITLSARAVQGPAPERTEVHVRVQDNGPGLPEDAVRLVFDPFALRVDSPMEYGISLMACYFIVHHHGGRIEAHSEPGRGTTFSLQLLTNPNQPPLVAEDRDFLKKALLNDALWENLISSD